MVDMELLPVFQSLQLPAQYKDIIYHVGIRKLEHGHFRSGVGPFQMQATEK